MSIQSKVCTKCGEDKDFSEYYNDKTKRDGKATICIICKKKKYNLLKTDGVSIMEKAIRSTIIAENRILKKEGKRLCSSCGTPYLLKSLSVLCNDCEKEKASLYYSQNREKALASTKKYQEENKEILKKKAKRYLEKNKERIYKGIKRHREDNIVEIRAKEKEYNEKYRAKNKDEINRKQREQRAKKKAEKLLNNPTSTLPKTH